MLNFVVPFCRKAEKERYKARKRACRERGEDLGPSRKQLRHNKMSKSTCKMKVAIDCDFDDYMAEKVSVIIMRYPLMIVLFFRHRHLHWKVKLLGDL